jgi:hypothetical protein
MTLPAAGQPISFQDINEELGRSSTAQLDLEYASEEFGLTAPHGMDELAGRTFNTFTFDTAQVTDWSITAGGTITAPQLGGPGTITSRTYVGSNGNTSYSKVQTDTTRTVNIIVRAPSSGYGNNNQLVSGSKTTTQPLSPVFELSDWTGQLSISDQGVISVVSTGNVGSVNIDTSNFGSVSTDTDRTVQFDLVNITDTSYYNSGGNLLNQTKTVTQPALVLPTYEWGGSLSVNANTGVVSVSGDDSAGTITLTPSSFDLVASATPRSVVVGNIVIPSGYQNAFTAFSETVGLTQLATQELITITSSTGTGVSGQGENFTITVNTTDIYDTQWEGFITYTDQSNSTNWVQLSAGNTGTGDDEFFVFVGPNYAGSTGYDGTTRYFDIRVDKVGGGLSSNTISFTQQIGTPPVQKPTFSVSPTSLDWTYSQSGTGNYQTITATHNGGSTPTSVSFYLSGIHYGLVQTDSNVPVNVSGGPWVAEATNDGAGSFQIGVYPLSSNGGSTDKTENLTISMGNSGGTTSTPVVPLTQTYSVNWSTDVSSLLFSALGGTKSITLDSSFSWTATVSGTGFSINTTSGGSGTNTISVTATQKDLGGSGTVTFSASGQTDIVVSLSQTQAPLEYTWFLNGVERFGSVTLTPGAISISYSVGLYAYRGSTAIGTTWMLQRTAGSWINAATTTSGITSFASTTSTQNTSGTPYLYLNIETNTGTARSGNAEITVDGFYVGTIYVDQAADTSGGGGGGDKPDPGDQI